MDIAIPLSIAGSLCTAEGKVVGVAGRLSQAHRAALTPHSAYLIRRAGA
jgi:hypothetical protein